MVKVIDFISTFNALILFSDLLSPLRLWGEMKKI